MASFLQTGSQTTLVCLGMLLVSGWAGVSGAVAAEESVSNPAWEKVLAERRTWWSFQPLAKVRVPEAKTKNWSDHPVDRFLLAKLEEQRLEPAAPADPRTLIRRLTFALTGLPPTPEEVEKFVSDSSNQFDHAVERLVDRLLASPSFGERWARHWMDLVRYAETHGSEGDPEIREAWRYRDYLIRAFNADVPADQLIREHIAGDLLPNPRLNLAEGINESLIGLAHLRLHEHGFQPVDTLEEQTRVLENQIDVLGKAFQGLTLACARCHDHKFDPVSQRDYTALYGVLASPRPAQVTIDTPERLTKNRAELTALKARIKEGLAVAWLKAAEQLPGQLLKSDRENSGKAKLEQLVANLKTELNALEREAEFSGRDALPRVRALADDQQVVPAAPVARWTFEGNARDSVGELHGTLLDGAVIRSGRLVLDGKAALVRTTGLGRDLKEKTLEAWVALSTLDQGGGGVMTVETSDGSVFDSIVFAEKQPRKWVAGSDHFRRSQILDGPAETASPEQFVHVAVVYGSDNRVAFYRNGQPYAPAYSPTGEQSELRTFTAGGSHVLFGRRHTGGGRAFLTGEIEEARLYDRALTTEEVASSFKAGFQSVSLADLLARMTPAQRAQHEGLRLRLAQAEQSLKALQDSTRAWNDTLKEAARNESHPLHPWARFQLLKPGESTASVWESIVARQRASPATHKEALSKSHQLVWDLSKGDERNWFRHGVNLPEQASSPGEFVIEPSGERVIGGLLPAGVYSHLLSQRHNGLFTSPRFKIETDSISVRALGGGGAMVRVIVDNYPLGSNPIFPKATLENARSGWVRLDTAYRKGAWAYLEFGTVHDLTRPIAGKGRGAVDGRSWYGVERVVFHDNAEPPVEWSPALQPFALGAAPSDAKELARLYGQIMGEAVRAWQTGKLDEAQRALLDGLLNARLLPVELNELPQLAPLVAEYRRLENEVPVPRHAPGVIEVAAYDAPFMNRGEHHKLGDPVPRGYLEVLGRKAFFERGNGVLEKGSVAASKHHSITPSLHHSASPASGRLELARALTTADNPLTARVLVNRVWSLLYGRGIVATVDNFGLLGDRPTHPELLDWLAARFMAEGWSFKKLIRELVLTRAYQMASMPSAAARVRDPANQWLSHFPLRRLEAEAIRDAMLVVSGRLDATPFGPPAGQNAPRRSVYLALRRNSLNAFLETFDAPKPFTTIGDRDATNVPAQSLTLLNDPGVIELAGHWARRVLRDFPDAPAETRVAAMFKAAFGRPPAPDESARSLAYLQSIASQSGLSPEQWLASEHVWQDFAQSLFNLKEFIYLR
jgi:hypothetical protein